VPGGVPIALSTACRGKKGASCEAEVKQCGWRIFSEDTSSSAALALRSSVGFACNVSGKRGPSRGSFRQVLGAKICSHPWDCCQLGVVKKESFELRA